MAARRASGIAPAPAENARLWAAAALLALLPGVAVYGHRGFAPAVFLLALVAATRVETWAAGRRLIAPPLSLSRPDRAALFAFLALCVWIALTGFWSPTPGAAKLAVSVFTPVLAAGALVVWAGALSGGGARRLGLAYLAAMTGGLVILCVEAASGGFLRGLIVSPNPLRGPELELVRLGRGLTGLAPGFFAAAAIFSALWAPTTPGGRIAARAIPAAAFAGALYAAAALPITANAAALVAGGLAAAAGVWRPKATLTALAALALALLLASPFLFAFAPLPALAVDLGLPASWLQRLYIWQAAGAAALDCLPLGCGADYARAVAAEGALVMAPGAAALLPLMPTHAHNVFLQVWLELGAPGVVFTGVVLIAGARLLREAELPSGPASALAGLAAALLVSAAVEASLWQVWRLAAAGIGVFGIALSLMVRNSLKHKLKDNRREKAPGGA